MDREQAKAITKYDCLFSIQMGLLLPWIVIGCLVLELEAGCEEEEAR